MVLNLENIDVAMSSFEQPKLTSMLYHQNLDFKKKIHFKSNIKSQDWVTKENFNEKHIFLLTIFRSLQFKLGKHL